MMGTPYVLHKISKPLTCSDAVEQWGMIIELDNDRESAAHRARHSR